MDKNAKTGYKQRVSVITKLATQAHRFRRNLARCWWIIILVAGGAVTIEWYLLKNAAASYVSGGRMIVDTRLNISPEESYAEQLNTFYDTQVQLMASDIVTNRTFEHLKARTTGTAFAPVKLSVTVSPRTSIFNLQVTGPDPAFAQAYLQETMEEYVKLKREMLSDSSLAARTVLESNRDNIGAQLANGKRAVLQFQSTNNMVFLQNAGGNDAADYFALLSRELTQRNSELNLLKTLTLDETLERRRDGSYQAPLNGQTARGASGSTSGVPENEIRGDGASRFDPGTDMAITQAAGGDQASSSVLSTVEADYLYAKQQMVLLKSKREDLGRIMRPAHPDMIALDEEIANEAKLLELYQDQSQQEINNRIHGLKVQIADLEGQIKEWGAKALNASEKLSDFQSMKADNERLQAAYDQVQTLLQSLDLDKGIGHESVSILEPASQAMPVPPKRLIHLLLAGFIGLAIGSSLLFFQNQMDDRVGSQAELEELFDEDVLGQLPFVRTPKGTTLKLEPDDERHTLVESFSNLRSALIFRQMGEEGPKSILVTSAIPGEGKSTVCANLAITLAQAGSQVLLIDADMRRGQVHKLFNVPIRPGFADVLAGKSQWQQAIARTSIENLDIMPCGEMPKRPSGLLIARAMKSLEGVEKNYDYCLFDAPPVMATDDAPSLAPQLDGAILVVRADSTSGRAARSALDALHFRNVEVLGLVFNAVSARSPEYRYYQFKEYYSQRP